jgi:hypothetical protein
MTDTLERGDLVRKLERFTKPKRAPKPKIEAKAKPKAKPKTKPKISKAVTAEAIATAVAAGVPPPPAMVEAVLPESAVKVPTKFKFAVRLRNRYTGIPITLGMRYDTREEAEKAGESECSRCNKIETVPAMADDYRSVREQLRD